MKEYSGQIASVDLDGPHGCAKVHVRVLMSVEDAKSFAALLLDTGSPIRVLFPGAVVVQRYDVAEQQTGSAQEREP